MSEQQTAPRFLFPRQGDVMVGQADGVWKGRSLEIAASVEAPGAARLTVNGRPAAKGEDGVFTAPVLLDGRVNRVEAVNPDTGEAQAVTVFVFEKAYHTYRFTVDDCIRAFEDLERHKEEYTSIFDNPFLAVFREAHELYGSKTHINMFYASYDGSFNLSMMTDRYRQEFEANADWLSFSFHARQEMPDLPYRDKGYDEVKADCLLTVGELRRIVGTAALRDTTTLHWGASTVEGARALRSLGYKALCGYFVFCHGEPYYDCYENGETIVSYYLSKEQTANLEHRCFWVDTDEDIVFAKLHMVLNAGDLPAERVGPFLDELAADPAASGFIQMVIHEQFFYQDYVAYKPDYRDRILAMARWMQEHGYRPVSLSDILAETQGQAW
ncbi:MAG TPA: hypothetical protein H9694_10765 [Firmicutes bacterium]|nr:hypothetical protein [Bacillota bacterium]